MVGMSDNVEIINGLKYIYNLMIFKLFFISGLMLGLRPANERCHY